MTGATIAELSELVRNQIAAGEVVERPASVVKELVENALDAGARRVRVDLEEGGTRLVRVADDGAGMVPEDVARAFLPHATSKLRVVEDLEHIASLGFRGEALASIGSVARCRLMSRPAELATGSAVENEGGQLGRATECGAPAGTTVEVRDLFFNTPARRRFLKRAATEQARCLDVLQRASLANAGVGFVVTHDGRRVFDVEPEMELRDRVRRLFGAELAESLEPLEARDGSTELTGLLAPPRFARRDTARQMWFLNGRALRDKVLLRALREGYRGFLDDHRQPVAFLVLAMDPARVDVNVHPTKAEVRFREERRLFGFVVRSVREALGRMDVATPGESLLRSVQRRGDWAPGAGQAALPDPGGLGSRPEEPRTPLVREVPGPAFEPPPPAPATGSAAGSADAGSAVAEGGGTWEAADDLRGPFLQIDRTYIVRALPDGFEVIDQHALHERLTFEGLRAEVRGGRVEVQRLLVPELVELSRSELRALETHAEALRTLGIEVAPFGETTLAVHGVPARLRAPDVGALVRTVLAVVEEEGRAPEPERLLEEVLHRTACRSSVMAGDVLDSDEIRSLLERARSLESDQTCPHGRPTRVRFTLADLEKAFHRR